MDDYQQVIASLRLSYNREKAEQRDQDGKEAWKVTQRQQFLEILQVVDQHKNIRAGRFRFQPALEFFRQIAHHFRQIAVACLDDRLWNCRDDALKKFRMRESCRHVVQNKKFRPVFRVLCRQRHERDG